jgi:hypothetical protein
MEQENYIKPEVEIYEVEVEQGFQASGEDFNEYPI